MCLYRKLSNMESEDMLKAVIEAQVRDGHFRWELLKGFEIKEGLIQFKTSPVETIEQYEILPILLDTEGCKAAYGEMDREVMPTYCNDWLKVSNAILQNWHSKKGNNWRAAIKIAYDLLPKQESSD